MPTIRSIELTALAFDIPKERQYGISRGPNVRRTTVLVAVTTESGVTGFGETIGPAGPVAACLEEIRPIYLGRSVHDPEEPARLARSQANRAGDVPFACCLSALDIAMHDAAGKLLGRPVYDLIGGLGRDRVPCYATTGYITAGGMADLESQLVRIDKTVLAGVKIKIGLNPSSDLERVRLARQILGDDLLLMVDVNANYSAERALESARLIAPYNIHWYEEPLPMQDIAGYVELRSRSPIPIATGENFTSVADFNGLIEARGADILQPALARCGGLTGGRAVAALCEAAGLRITPGVWGGAYLVAASVHFMASRPVADHAERNPFPHMLEYDMGENPFRETIVDHPVLPQPGGARVPAGPGLGLVLNRDAAEAYRS